VVRLGQLPELPVDLSAWLASGLARTLLVLLLLELALAILSDLLGRLVSLFESLLAMEQFFVEYRAAKVP